MQNLGRLAEVTEPEHVSTQLLPLFTDLTQDGKIYFVSVGVSIVIL